MLELHEPINVWVYFRKNRAEPLVFFWKSRRITVDKINLMHTSKDGSTTYYHFSVSAGDNFYRLRFDTVKLTWILEAVEEG